MEELTIEEIYLLHNLMAAIKSNEGKFTLEELAESPIYERAFNKLSNMISDFVKDKSK